MNDPEHGTYNGYQWHVRHDVPKCEPCMAARRQYVAEHRAADPEVMRRHKAMAAAAAEASKRLRDSHPDEYRTYYDEAITKIYTDWEGCRA